jgi:protein SCO1/2
VKRIAMPLIAFLALVLTLPAKAAGSPDLTGVGYTQRIGARLPLDIVLRDEAGDGVALAEALGRRPVILLLGYFRCRKLCNALRAQTLDALVASGLAADRDYRLVAISVDPSETSADAAAAKERDVEAFPAPGARKGWRYLTGEEGDVGRVSRAVGFDYAYDAERKTFSHPIGRVLLDREGVVSAYLFGFGLDGATLRATLGSAAAHEKTEMTSVSLFCFEYDPATGRYTLAIMKLLRLLSIAAALLVIVSICNSLRRRSAE